MSITDFTFPSTDRAFDGGSKERAVKTRAVHIEMRPSSSPGKHEQGMQNENVKQILLQNARWCYGTGGKQKSSVNIWARATLPRRGDVFCSPHSGPSPANLVSLFWPDVFIGKHDCGYRGQSQNRP